MTQMQHAPQPMSPQQRAFMLQDYLARCVTNGARVELQLSPFDAQVAWPKGKGPNHILHLLLTLFTFGLWLPVWMIIGLVGPSPATRFVVAVDEWGQVRQVDPSSLG
jgi:hypothetical protein